MDEDSSAKFIGSLTKFLQSLCNGYVEFQKGVELVGHIYLNIDTGEKVDYILHERVSKNDENSVSFLSNSFHAQPTDKKDGTGKEGARSKGDGRGCEQASDDDDIMIVDQSERMPGSTNTGTVPNRGLKRAAGSDSRLAHGFQSQHRNRNSSPGSSQPKYRQPYGGPSATVTNQNAQQDNISIGDVKLEQLSADELLSLASQVDDGASSSHASSDTGPPLPVKQGSPTLDSSAGQPVWIKQEAPDESQGGHDTGWPHSHDGQSDSSNSGSDLYPVMMHHNSAYSSNPVFPGFTSSQSSSGSRHHSQSLPGMSGAANPYANPMAGTSQDLGGIDPAVLLQEKLRRHARNQRYYQRLKGDPERFRRVMKKDPPPPFAVKVWKKRVWSRTYWQQVKLDPNRHERHKQSARESMRKLRAQQKAQRHLQWHRNTQGQGSTQGTSQQDFTRGTPRQNFTQGTPRHEGIPRQVLPQNTPGQSFTQGMPGQDLTQSTLQQGLTQGTPRQEFSQGPTRQDFSQGPTRQELSQGFPGQSFTQGTPEHGGAQNAQEQGTPGHGFT
ncbi:hypothetical protein ACOMHN_036058 [Nucella lapillus]